jgi:hypothetical protein
MNENGWQKTPLGKSYLRKLKKASGLNKVQLESREKQIAVFVLLYVRVPKWSSWGDIVRSLDARVSTATISKVLKTFMDEKILEKLVNPKNLLGEKNYRYNLYRLKLTKYFQRPFVRSAKSYVMSDLEDFPNLLYGLAFWLEVA